MSTIEETSFYDDLDRKCLDLSSKLAEPFCWAYSTFCYRLFSTLEPNKFDNASNKVAEIAIRTFIGIGALFTFGFIISPAIFTAVALSGISCKLFRAIGVALQKNQFTHVKGTAPEKPLEKGQAKIMTWDLCGHCGGLHYDDGGMIQWRSRIDSIVQKIEKEDPDVLVLQEISDTAFAEVLIDKLQSQYAHFFIHVGINTWGTASGCMIITKNAVHQFSHTDFETNQFMVNEGFATLEIKARPEDDSPSLKIIGTRISTTDPEKSKKQMLQVVDAVAKEKKAMPTFFVGNVKDDGEDLSKYLHHSYRGKEPTETNEFLKEWGFHLTPPSKVSDFVSLFRRNITDGTFLPVIEKNIRMLDCHLVEAFTSPITHRPPPLSNHHGIVTTFEGL